MPVVASAPPRLVVAAGAIQPWKLRGGDEPPVLDADAVRAFAEPGWVTAGLAFFLEPDGEGTRLRTETRVRATNARTRACFGLYWLSIRAGSGLSAGTSSARSRGGPRRPRRRGRSGHDQAS